MLPQQYRIYKNKLLIDNGAAIVNQQVINEEAEEKEPGKLEITTTTVDESDYESDESEEKLDMSDPDTKILLMKTTKEMMAYMITEFGDLDNKRCDVDDDLPIESAFKKDLINENGKRPFVTDEPGEIIESKQLNMGNYNISSGFLTKWFILGHDDDKGFVKKVDNDAKREPVEPVEIINERRMKQRLKLQALKDMVSKNNNNFEKN
jgi:hypothetical protein